MWPSQTLTRICLLCAALPACLERTKPQEGDSGTSGPEPTEDGEVDPGPDIRVSARTLDFSASPLSVSVVQELTITNDGTEDLVLQ